MSVDVAMLAELSLEELLLCLADTQAVGAAPLDDSHRQAVGMALLRGWFAKLKGQLCGSSFNSDTARDLETVT